ncbi:MAG: hypothetical protein FJZ80_02475 [Bacteroidetes bacterium]|nr:hypothetical protein [Bacteroidota bacterium]
MYHDQNFRNIYSVIWSMGAWAGGVIMLMRSLGKCFLGFYAIEDSENSAYHMSSMVFRRARGKLEFNLLGESLTPIKSIRIVRASGHPVLELNVYIPEFNQHVVFHKIT